MQLFHRIKVSEEIDPNLTHPTAVRLPLFETALVVLLSVLAQRGYASLAPALTSSMPSLPSPVRSSAVR